MDDHGLTQWDRLVVPYWDVGLVTCGRDEELVKRQVVRLVWFERLVDEALGATTEAERRSRAKAVGREYEYRLRQWFAWRGQLHRDDEFKRRLWVQLQYSGSASGHLVLWIPLTFLIVLTARAFGFGRMRRLQRSLRRRRCADCGYDLSGCRPALPEPEVGWWIGPDQCPECGGRWPMVPPRVEYGAAKGT